MKTISLEEQVLKPALSLSGGNEMNNSGEVQEDLADKYSLAMGNASPGRDVVLAGIRSGNTKRFQELLSQQKIMELETERNNLIQTIARNKTLSPLDLEIVRKAGSEEIVGPNQETILQEEYARNLNGKLLQIANENSLALSEAELVDAEKTKAILNRVNDQSARSQIAYELLDQTKAKFDKSGLLSQGLAWGQVIFPFRTWTALSGFTKGNPFGNFLPGDNVEDQVLYLNSLPPSEYKKVITEGVNRAISEGNYIDAMTFLEAAISYSDTDKGIENLFAGLDVASVLPLGTLSKIGGRATKASTHAIKDVERVTSVAGLPKTAVDTAVKEALAAGKLPSFNIRNAADVERTLPSLFRPQEAFVGGILRAGAAALNRLQTAAIARAGTAAEILTNVNRVERLAPQQIEQAFKEAEDYLTANFVHQNHYINNITRSNSSEFSLKQTSDSDFVISKSGKDIGELAIKLEDNGDTLVVDWVGTNNSSVNSIGPRNIRNLLRDLQTKFPNAKRIKGLRISGARNSKSLKGEAWEAFKDDYFGPNYKPTKEELDEAKQEYLDDDSGMYDPSSYGEGRSLDTEIKLTPLKKEEELNKLSLTRNYAEDSPANVYSVTMTIGKKDGSAFGSENGAKAAAARFLKITDDYTVKQMDDGWVIEVSKDVDETSEGVKALKINTDNKTPDNPVTRFLGTFVGADQRVSRDQSIARGVATLSVEHMGHLLEEFSKPIRALTKKEFKEFEDFLIRSRDVVKDDGTRGISFKSVFEIEDAFHQQYNKLPTHEQLDAIMAFQQTYDLDWIVRDLDVYKQKSRLGIEKIGIKVGDETIDFEGKEITSLPRGSKSYFNWAIVDDDGTIRNKPFAMKDDDWAAIDQLKADGYKVIQPYKGNVKVGEKNYNFIISRNFNRGRVGLMNFDYKSGSRMLDKSPWFGKQARIGNKEGRVHYNGDSSIFGAKTLEEGKEILKHFEEIRKMIKGRNPKVRHLYSPAIKRYFDDHLPMWSPKRFMDEVKAGNISLDVPFTMVRAGSSTNTTTNLPELLAKEGINVNGWIDDNEFDLSKQVTGRFIRGNREENMEVYGIEKDTVFQLEGDQYMSPMDTLRLSMGNMVDTHVVGDYRIKSARDFTREFGDILDGTPSDFDNNGLEFIFRPTYKAGADANRIKVAEGLRTTILSLFNHRTAVDRQIDMYKERVLRTIGSKLGPGVEKWVGDNALPFLGSLDQKARSFAFHTKMGFFNPKQLFLQASTALNVISISPTHGVKGARAISPLMFALKVNRNEVAGVAKKYAKTAGFSADEFTELVDVLKRSGFQHVKGDVAYLDDYGPPKVIKGKLSNILDVGATPFRWGEKIARTMAFATAYSERKATLKGKAVTRADEAWILQRAKDLTGNMTRDSNAAFQKGYGAVFTQFFGFQMRLMEQMIGVKTKLTRAERMRLFAGMSTIYGVPVAAGMTFGVWPIRDWLKDTLANNGIVYDDTLAEPFIDGWASWLLEQISGADYNISEKYGPGGLTTFYEFLKGDADWSEVLLGASGGIIGDTIKDFDPIVKSIYSSLDVNDMTSYPFTWEDLLEPLRNISTVNSAVKLWEGVNLKQWISQNENYLTEVDSVEAAFGAVFGLDPERVSDAFNNLGALSTRKELQEKGIKEAVIQYRRGIKAMRSGNREEALKYFGRAKTIGILNGLELRQMNEVFRRAIDDEPLDESVLRNYEKYILGE